MTGQSGASQGTFTAAGGMKGVLMWDKLGTWMADGGPVMWPLAVTSILGLSVTIRETGCFLLSYKSWDSKQMARVLEAVETGDFLTARQLSQGVDPVSRWYRKRLSSWDMTKNSGSGSENLPEAGLVALSFLSTIAALAPLMGILGTVLGIIQSFSALGDMAAMHEVSAGIAQALISTAAGLIVAVSALLPHNLLSVLHTRWHHTTVVWAERLECALGDAGRIDETSR
ncbi:MAG: MotA/TolQ/ExbB proton channel family protein [Proteobacteria bacterium]|nr:MotA/TolQ/ExbB proton channel family protein [Pseudomonadota bacterium]